MNKLIYTISILICIAFGACKKTEGTGGRAQIVGKVYGINLTSSLVLATDSAYMPGINVYITYGSNNTIGDKVESGLGGAFSFPYLQPGSYKVYAISKQLNGGNKLDTVIVKTATIAQKGETVDIGDLRIYTSKN